MLSPNPLKRNLASGAWRAPIARAEAEVTRNAKAADMVEIFILQ